MGQFMCCLTCVHIACRFVGPMCLLVREAQRSTQERTADQKACVQRRKRAWPAKKARVAGKPWHRQRCMGQQACDVATEAKRSGLQPGLERPWAGRAGPEGLGRKGRKGWAGRAGPEGLGRKGWGGNAGTRGQGAWGEGPKAGGGGCTAQCLLEPQPMKRRMCRYHGFLLEPQGSR